MELAIDYHLNWNTYIMCDGIFTLKLILCPVRESFNKEKII